MSNYTITTLGFFTLVAADMFGGVTTADASMHNQPTSFVPIVGPAPIGFEFAPGAPGWNFEQNFYPDGNIIHGVAGAPLNNYTVHTSGVPAPLSSTPGVSPIVDFGPGGALGANLPWPGGDGDDFSMRANAFVTFPSAGSYNVQHGADDTTYILIDTVADGTLQFERDCCGDTNNVFNITQPGTFPVDFVFGENGGGAWTDLEIRDAGNIPLQAFTIGLQASSAVPEPNTFALGVLALMGLALPMRRRRVRVA